VSLQSLLSSGMLKKKAVLWIVVHDVDKGKREAEQPRVPPITSRVGGPTSVRLRSV
jgi:hypothetical protein